MCYRFFDIKPHGFIQKLISYLIKFAYLTVDRLNDGNRFIVREGLSVGDTIVAEGVGLVREGMSITPKNEPK